MGTSSAAIAPPASDGHAFGTARDITAKRSGLPPPLTPPKSPWRSEGAHHEHTSVRINLSRCYHHRWSGMGFCLSAIVGGEEGRESPCVDREPGAGCASSR